MATVHVVILLVYSYIIKTIPLPIGHSTLRQLELLLDLSYPSTVGKRSQGHVSFLFTEDISVCAV